MRAVVVYESMFGNTHEVAERIGAGLGSRFDVAVMSVGDAISSVVPEAELVVVGGPTHAHGMSRSVTRKGAADQAAEEDELHLEPGADGPGLREWFDALPKVGSAMAAAFDTRVEGPPMVTGHASKAIAKRLSRHGFRLVVDPESFLVDRQNVLVDGEADRAEQWAARLAEQVAAV